MSSFIENDVIIGNNVTVKPGVQLWDGMRIGNDVFIGPNVSFTNYLAPPSKQYPTSFQKTIIGNGVSLGVNSTIKGGIEIGDYTMIGAGSLVTKSILPFHVYYGNPATHKWNVTKSGQLLNKALVDKQVRHYHLNNSEPILI